MWLAQIFGFWLNRLSFWINDIQDRQKRQNRQNRKNRQNRQDRQQRQKTGQTGQTAKTGQTGQTTQTGQTRQTVQTGQTDTKWLRRQFTHHTGITWFFGVLEMFFGGKKLTFTKNIYWQQWNQKTKDTSIFCAMPALSSGPGISPHIPCLHLLSHILSPSLSSFS